MKILTPVIEGCVLVLATLAILALWVSLTDLGGTTVVVRGIDGVTRTVHYESGADGSDPEVRVQISELMYGDTCREAVVTVDHDVRCVTWGPNTADRAATL